MKNPDVIVTTQFSLMIRANLIGYLIHFLIILDVPKMKNFQNIFMVKNYIFAMVELHEKPTSRLLPWGKSFIYLVDLPLILP